MLINLLLLVSQGTKWKGKFAFIFIYLYMKTVIWKNYKLSICQRIVLSVFRSWIYKIYAEAFCKVKF